MQRYNRQMRFSPFGEQGQHALSNAKLLILGAGALGSHVAELLARMGHIKSQLLIWILLKRLIYIDKRFILKMTHKIWYQKSTQ